MLAAYYDRQGTADDVLVVGAVADPEPGFGEVRVRVAISGVNPTDIKARKGFAGAPMAYPRIIPHHDGAGTIDKVGPGVAEARLGERVWLYRAQYDRPYGTAAEFVVVPSNLAVPLPDSASFETGACLGVAAITAHRCLFADGGLRGRRVLVQGGGGAVGTAAILLAKWAGAWVAATVSRPEQEKVALDAGADLAINRHSEDVAAAIRHATKGAGVERIVDVDLAKNVDVDIASLAPGGIVAAYATEDPAAKLIMPFRTAMFGSYVFRFVFFTTIPDGAFQRAVKEVTACVAAGRYRPHIGLDMPMQHIAQAHAAQESGKIVGKILVRIGD
ncbi:NADPH:quinone reductase [Mesorhizobium sp. CO1-1-11]|uniref:NADPH:quinone reductase n=1 Tax=Mesorhizobium sp. CO1-1-11 TaxID=2876636 RepID=UPI001CC9E994|nr:NADPH:quinone reductase [Mesorhizobium sp. CO1-1-11]MBZ9726291.1 NADPH:quinone reductase [Mesorhizobium sp. CO1-1-11]